MTRRPIESVAVEIFEPAGPAEVTVVHLSGWYGVPDLWVYRAADRRVRTVTPVRDLPQPLPEGELRGGPPVGRWLAAQGV